MSHISGKQIIDNLTNRDLPKVEEQSSKGNHFMNAPFSDNKDKKYPPPKGRKVNHE